MTVLVRLGLRRAWMKPSLQRTACDTLEWVVLFQEGEGNGYVDLRSDEELVIPYDRISKIGDDVILVDVVLK